MASNRTVVAAMTLSAAAFVGILTREGYTDNAVIPVPGDVPTIGFGTTGDVKMGDRTTPVAAAQRALLDASKFEGALKQCVKAPLSQKEYDLYVDFSYNIGSGAFCSSTLVKKLNAQDYVGACQQILVWKKFTDNRGVAHDCSAPGNKICMGLWKDRLRQHNACMEAQG